MLKVHPPYPKETLLYITSWEIIQALLCLLHHLNKGLWLALLVPDSGGTFVTQCNNKAALATHCFMLEIAKCALEAQDCLWESSVVLHHLWSKKCMQQSTWTWVTSLLSSASFYVEDQQLNLFINSLMWSPKLRLIFISSQFLLHDLFIIVIIIHVCES